MIDVDLNEDKATLLRRAFGCFPTGVAAVCAVAETGPVGMAVSSFTSVSLEPPLLSVCMQNSSTTWPTLRRRPAWDSACSPKAKRVQANVSR